LISAGEVLAKYFWYLLYFGIFLGIVLDIVVSSKPGTYPNAIGDALSGTITALNLGSDFWTYAVLLGAGVIITVSVLLYHIMQGISTTEGGVYLIPVGFIGILMTIYAGHLLFVNIIGIVILAAGAVFCYRKEKEAP
jgi:hypothetical protein